jgi:hypothetical protein
MSFSEHIQRHNARHASRFDSSTLALPPARHPVVSAKAGAANVERQTASIR